MTITAETELERVDFGRLDAESDTKLLDYFLVTGTVREVSDGAKLVIGRKGAGKTALFTHLAARLKSAVVTLDLHEYVFELHRGFVQLGLTPDRAYTASWRLLIYTAMFSALQDQMPPALKKKGVEILQNLGVGEDRTFFRGMFDWLKRVRKVELPSIEGVAAVGALEIDAENVSPLSAGTIHAIKTLEEILQEQVQTTPVTVLLDRLDDAWDGSEDSLHLIAGAVRATRDVSIAFGNPRPAPVITFLRTDLWEKISFNDRNKMSQDIIYLDWDTDGLASIVDRRIRTSIGSEIGAGWDRIFTTGEMRQRASAKTYILKRALGRPRDVVAFATFARNEALNSEHDKIEAADIYEAEKRYSKHILDELKDEIERHVSDFAVVINTLKGLRTRTFTAASWNEVATQNGLSKTEASRALEQLFEASAVGIHGVGGASGGSGTIYRYQDRHLRSRDDAGLQVHLALVRELGLKDS
jgi:hypothetical protein